MMLFGILYTADQQKDHRHDLAQKDQTQCANGSRQIDDGIAEDHKISSVIGIEYQVIAVTAGFQNFQLTASLVVVPDHQALGIHQGFGNQQTEFKIVLAIVVDIVLVIGKGSVH